jgi:acetoin utilization deacetylase AcuC-like enzyme
MRSVFPDGKCDHRPKFEFDRGKLIKAFDTPNRIMWIRNVLAAEFPQIEPVIVTHASDALDVVVKLLPKVHSTDYIAFLRESAEHMKATGVKTAMYPSVFPAEHCAVTSNLLGRHGQFCSDTYTPLFAGTFDAVLMAASVAVAGAQIIAEGLDNHVYALCRPPGHHAERARSGGYCYINNCGIAAHYLTQIGRVVILDLDAHHGNGTQDIFWDRDDVLTLSLHGDPRHLFPYYTGYADETGAGIGAGLNFNYPLPIGISDHTYQSVLEVALDRIQRYSPDALIVALGVDTHESDPLGQFCLSSSFFKRMGEIIRQLGLPTLVVQEGGYNRDFIGVCVAGFLRGLSGEII